MKKILMIIMAVAFGLTACELERSENGDFDGVWKMQGVDSLSNGKHADLHERQVAYAVQKDLLQLSGNGPTILCRFQFQGDSLIVSDPRSAGGNDPSTDNLNHLRGYGIDRLPMSFHIDALSSSRMILKSEALRLYFEKY